MPDALLPDVAATEDPDWSERIPAISLFREPASHAANGLTATIAGLIEPFLDRDKKLGHKGRRTHRRTTGTVLAGVLNAGLRGEAVRVPAGRGTDYWPNAPLGHRAFWQRVNALEQAGLLSRRAGVAFWNGVGLDGNATALWCTPALRQLATNHGLTVETFAADWPVTEEAQTKAVTVAIEELVGFCEVPAKGSDARTPCAIPAHQVESVEDARRQVARFNAHLASATVRGCVAPVLRRRCFADMRLGGRFIAPGPDTFQSLRKADRSALRINGKPVVEVDLVAALLSIFLAITRQPIPADPYAHGPLAGCNKRAVKRWANQTLNSGRPASRWADNTDADVKAVKIKPIATAALAAYPGLRDAPAMLPDDLRSVIPLGREGWALGQWLTGFEASVMSRTLERLNERGVTALPLHDAVLVPLRDAEAAKQALEDAFVAVLGIRPQVKVKDAVS